MYAGLVESVNLDNPAIFSGVLMLQAGVALLLLWFGFGRPRALWGGLALLLLAADLISFGQSFHPLMPTDSLAQTTHEVAFLRDNAGLYRVFNRQRVPSLEPNRLLTFRVPDFSGYSSLPPRRHDEYSRVLRRGNNGLLDLAGIRYVVDENRFISLPSYQGVSFHPGIPLAAGAMGNPNARATFRVPVFPATHVEAIANMEGAPEVTKGTAVAELTVVGEWGERQVVFLRAGEHVAEAAIDSPDVAPRLAHAAPMNIAFSLLDTDSAGRKRYRYLYHSAHPLKAPGWVKTVEFRSLLPHGKVTLWGLSLYSQPNYSRMQARDNARFNKVYEDPSVQVFENTSVLPRAFVVHDFVVIPAESKVIAALAEGPYDPRVTAVLERQPRELPTAASDVTAGRSTATVASHSPQQVTVEVNAAADGLLVLTDSDYPGWVARVDGEVTPVYRADYLFRAVPVTRGLHTVEFAFESRSVELGKRISIGGFAFLAALWLALAGAWVCRRLNARKASA